MGYGKKGAASTETTFDDTLKAVLTVPPPKRDKKSGDQDDQEPELEPVR